MRKHVKSWSGPLVALILLGTAIGAAGCYVAPVGIDAEYEVGGPPPVVQEEAVVPTPGAGYVWINGYWDWDVGRHHWAWSSGRWEQPPKRGQRWTPSHFETRNGKHYYRRGRWHD